MKFALAKEHFDFFYKHHYLELESLLTLPETEALKRALTETLSTRLHTEPEKLEQQSLKKLYLNGFDTWRSSDIIKKCVFRSPFAALASNLAKKTPLRIGFDQVLYTPAKIRTIQEEMPPLFDKQISLKQMSCLQGVICALLLQFSLSDTHAIREETGALIPAAHAVGNGLLLAPDTPISFPHLMKSPNTFQLLITYAQERTVYRLNEDDPHTHVYKKFGYTFGDRLKNTTHPILYR